VRKQDIRVTTPEETTLYAFGNKALNDPKIFEDPDSFYFGGYRPAYVLDFKDGRVLALVANAHPESNRGQGRYQDDPDEAAKYSLEDYLERLEKLAPFSRSWGLTEEERTKRREVFEKLKAVPNGWTLGYYPASSIKMLWADYDLQLKAKQAERAEAAQFKKDQEKDEAERAEAAIAKLKGWAEDVGFELAKEYDLGKPVIVFDKHYHRVEIPLELTEILLDRAEALLL
jgi:hypothetical protein